MAQAQQNSHVALLGTVVLLLDDEAEAVGAQLLRLFQTLDPLAQARLRLLRVSRNQGELKAVAFTTEDRQLVAVETAARVGAQVGGGPPSLPPLPAHVPGGDPNATQMTGPTSAPRISYGVEQDFEVALRGALQEALRRGGTGPLAERGFALVPNELAVHIVGRVDSPLLADVAYHAHDITHTISALTDARRFALLLAVSPVGEPERAATPPPRTSRLQGAMSIPTWQSLAQKQPWQELLSWRSGDPPLHYTFMFEAWDEAGRFHERPQLYYSVAEAIFALFATGMLEQAAMKDALDLSTAAMEDRLSLTRVGSIGTSLITSPTQGMIDYLAHRLAADVLLRRGLLGEEGAILAPDLRASIPDHAQRNAEHWLTGTWQMRMLPELHPLPKRLPPREMPGGKSGTWHPLALSVAGPSPEPLLWRWERSRLPLDDENFWNLAIQHEYETSADAQEWRQKSEATYATQGQAIWQHLDSAILAQTLEPEGIERAHAFTDRLRELLAAERDRLDRAASEQEKYLDLHYRQFEEQIRRQHSNNGIPTRQNPPDRRGVPLMPRNLEAITHEVLDAKADRVPMPVTMITVALVLAAFGALAVAAIPAIPGFAQVPDPWHAIFMGNNAHWLGALIGLLIFALGSLGAWVRYGDLRRGQRRFAGERLLLRLAQAKNIEREQHLSVIEQILHNLDGERQVLLTWANDVRTEADALNQRAAVLAADYTAAPTLSRDVFISNGELWDGSHPDALYLQVRQHQNEAQLVRDFLQYVQAHAEGVPNALEKQRLANLALAFMYDHLRAGGGGDPFANWQAATAQATLDRAMQEARVAMQPQPSGRPIGHFAGVMVHPSVDWLPRAAHEEQIVVMPAPTTRWAFVARVITRTAHPLVQDGPTPRAQ
jgi:hypothetical protein